MKLNRQNAGLEKKLPIKIVQFGEGNFLRAFVDYAFQQLNNKLDFNAGVAVVQPIDKGLVDLLNEQEGLYTLFMKGVQKGTEIQEKELISNIVKAVDPYQNFDDFLDLAKEEALSFVISNTTEAGIAYIENDEPGMQPPSSFPAKLALLLYERFKHFKGDASKGLTIIPCELINYNADTLKDIILRYIEDWKLDNQFKTWLLTCNSFHNTLVDRIVPGYPKDEIDKYRAELDYEDKLIVSAELFFLWVIEGDEKLKVKLPFHKTDLDVKIVADMQPYRTRKVRILNGAHTALVPLSLMYGNTTVKESIENEFTGNFIRKAVFDEIIATLEMDKSELQQFANEVFDRFSNSFIKHQLSSIALNSVSKFKVRVLPSILEYIKIEKKVPLHLSFAFACLIRFYKRDWKGSNLPVDDDADVMATFARIWESTDYHDIVDKTLSNVAFWGQDLTMIENLPGAITTGLIEIEASGIEQGFANYCNRF